MNKFLLVVVVIVLSTLLVACVPPMPSVCDTESDQFDQAACDAAKQAAWDADPESACSLGWLHNPDLCDQVSSQWEDAHSGGDLTEYIGENTCIPAFDEQDKCK